MMTFINGLIGIAMVSTFLGIMAWWIKELPITIIVVGVVLLMIYDFVQTVRHGDTLGGR
jgi:phosphotransferase system  glucose/maltose/N-acetylglucosamine-specific IIC component